MNELEDDVNEEKGLENDSSVETHEVNTSSLDNRLNVKDNAAKMLNNRLQGNFVSKNVVKTQNHLEKYEKKLRLKKLKKIRMLASNDDLYFACLEHFESHYQLFRLKSRFFYFCEILFLILKIYIIFYI